MSELQVYDAQTIEDHPDLIELQEKIIASEIGLRGISASVYEAEAELIETTLQVQEPKKFNVLEEFVLKAIESYTPLIPQEASPDIRAGRTLYQLCSF